jgi:hypothetical protein
MVAVQVADMPAAVLVPVWRAAADNDGIHAFAAVASSLRRANDQSKYHCISCSSVMNRVRNRPCHGLNDAAAG